MSTKIKIYSGQPAATSAAVFTATKPTTIDAFTVCNPTGTDRQLDVWIGDAATDANQLYKDLVVSANTQQTVALINHAVTTGEAIYLQSSAATSLAVRISGRQE